MSTDSVLLPPKIQHKGFTLSYCSIPNEGRFHVLCNASKELCRFKAQNFDISDIGVFESVDTTDYMSKVLQYNAWLDAQPKFVLSSKAYKLIECVVEAAKEKAYADEFSTTSAQEIRASKRMVKNLTALQLYIAELEQRPSL